jgi:hypothetical protein
VPGAGVRDGCRRMPDATSWASPKVAEPINVRFDTSTCSISNLR